jgi:hypothetical protein
MMARWKSGQGRRGHRIAVILHTPWRPDRSVLSSLEALGSRSDSGLPRVPSAAAHHTVTSVVIMDTKGGLPASGMGAKRRGRAFIVCMHPPRVSIASAPLHSPSSLLPPLVL